MTDPQLLTRHQIDDLLWNKLIENSLHPVVYAYSWYLDCVAPEWQALVITSHQEYSAVVPLPVRKKWGFPVLYQPYFCQFLGIFTKQVLTEAEYSALFKALHQRFPYISQYAFHPDDSAIVSRFISQNADVSYHQSSTYWLDIKRPYREIKQKYSTDRRNNIHKTRHYVWELVKSGDVEPLIRLFRQNHEKQIPGGVAASTYTILRNLVSQVSQNQATTIYYAILNGEVHAGIMVVEANEMGIYLFNAADALGRKGNARTWLLDWYFQEKAGTLTWFDFESPDIDNISNFYQSFGAREKSFYTIQKNKLPFPIRQLQEWRKRMLRTI